MHGRLPPHRPPSARLRVQVVLQTKPKLLPLTEDGEETGPTHLPPTLSITGHSEPLTARRTSRSFLMLFPLLWVPIYFPSGHSRYFVTQILESIPALDCERLQGRAPCFSADPGHQGGTERVRSRNGHMHADARRCAHGLGRWAWCCTRRSGRPGQGPRASLLAVLGDTGEHSQQGRRVQEGPGEWTT